MRFLRSYRSFVALFLFLAGLELVVIRNWSSFISFWAPGQDISVGAREMFYYLTLGHLLLVTFLTPFLMAPSIAGEQEQSTLELIFSSPISIPHIMFAKLISPLLFVLLLIVSASPVLSICLWGGGMDIGNVARSYLILIVTTITYGCLGLFCSSLRPRVYEVYLVASGMILIFALFLPYHGSMWEYMTTFQWYESSNNNHSMQYFSPFFALLNEFNVPEYLKGKMSWLPDPIASFLSGKLEYFNFAQGGFLFLSFSMCTAFLAGTAVQLRRTSKGQSIDFHLLPEEEEYEDDIPIHEREDTISFDDTSQEGNPGKVLEQRVQWFAKLPILIRLFYSSLMISIVTLPLASYNGSWLFLSLPFITSAIFTLPLSATSISSDRERGLLDLVRTTLLTPKQIVEAKFSTNLQYSFLIALALYVPGMALQLICSFLGYEVDLATNSSSTLAIILYPIVLFISLVIYTAYGLYCSAKFQRTNRSLIAAGTAILITLSIPFFLPPPPAFTEAPFDYLGTLLLAFCSPLMGIAVLFPQDSVSMTGRSLLLVHDDSFALPIMFVLVQCCLYLIGTLYLYQQTIKRLDRLD